MPSAAHHEIKVTKLPPENRFAALVYCEGCKWQSHVMKEENAEQVGRQHQAAWGYEAKKPEPVEELKPEPQKPAVVVKPAVVAKPQGVK